jgi:hypothetical protein
MHYYSYYMFFTRTEGDTMPRCRVHLRNSSMDSNGIWYSNPTAEVADEFGLAGTLSI